MLGFAIPLLILAAILSAIGILLLSPPPFDRPAVLLCRGTKTSAGRGYDSQFSRAQITCGLTVATRRMDCYRHLVNRASGHVSIPAVGCNPHAPPCQRKFC